MGTPPFAARCLDAILHSRHRVLAVVTRPDKPRGRGKKLQACAVKELALERGIEVLDPPSARDPQFEARLRELAPDIAVVVAYGRILPLAILDLPRLGCINAHASLLPRLRGAAPIERAILEGEAETGVTIMQMDEGLDTGPALLDAKIAIGARMDSGDLRDALCEIASRLLPEALDGLAASALSAAPQDDAASTYAPLLDKNEASIDWTAAAALIDRQVRGFAPRPGAFTFEGGKRLKILAGTPLDTVSDAEAGSILGVDHEGLLVACGQGTYRVETLQPEGKRSMNFADYERGRRDDGGPRRLHSAT